MRGFTTAGSASPACRTGMMAVLAMVLAFLPVLVSDRGAVAQETDDGNLATITGTVVDAVTRAPIPGVIVELTGQGFRLQTDALGVFTLSRIPIGDYRLELSHPDYHPAVGDFSIMRSGEFETAMEPVVEGGSDELLTGIVGVVSDSRGNTPIDDVSVNVQQGRRGAMTDVRGRFALEDLTPGMKMVRFSGLGYATRTEVLEVFPGRVTNVRISLSPDPVQLDPIEVTVERREYALQETGFYNRADEGFGEFIDREAIEMQRPAEMSDIFTRLPGVEIFADPENPLERYIVLRGGRQSSLVAGSYQRCFPKVVLDGLVMNQGGDEPAMLDRIIDPGAVAGVEVFPSSSGVPVQYAGGGASCGVILIWTRR